MTLGQKIKKLRMDKGLTQKDLADKVFVTFQTVSKWEKDENEPDVATLRELAKLFGCSMDYLLSEEEVVTPKEEEKPAVVPVAPVEQVTKTVIIHQKELHVCERCKKDIPEDELAMEDVPHHHGRSITYNRVYYHKDCLEQTQKERAAKEEATRKEKAKGARIKCFGWGAVAGIAVLVIFMISLLASGEMQPVASVFLSIGLGYAAFAAVYCILSGSYIGEVFLTVASWSIHFPGVIFTLDIEGLIFLIVVKVLFAILGFLFGILVLILAVTLSMVLSAISFPFILIHNIHTDYIDAL